MMSLQTPDNIRRLQRKLYLKAKAESDFRFYLLYDKVYREDILHHAYDLARSNKGSPGVDGVTFEMIEAKGLDEWLSDIRKDLVEKTYRPAPVRRVMIPKPGGNGERPLGIPTIRDRVIQGAAKLVLEPIFEADLDPSAYGYRPKRGGPDAIKEVHELLCRGYTDVVDADLSKYFDTIPHRDLIQSVARRIVDRNILRLIKLWLKAPVEERDGEGKRHMSGGRHSTCGTPQGGVASPHAEEALAWTRRVMAKLGLALNETKTSVRNARQEHFGFLGYTFGSHYMQTNGRWYLGASPSKKSVQRVKDKVGEILVPGNQAPWPEVRDQLNSLLRGWRAYFNHGSRQRAYETVDQHVYHSVQRFLVRRHKVPTHGTRRFTYRAVYGVLGVLKLVPRRHDAPPCALG